jgi:hypothetical protein
MNITNYNESSSFTAHEPRSAPKRVQFRVPTLEGIQFDQIRHNPIEDSTLTVTMVANRALSAQSKKKSEPSKRKAISLAENGPTPLKQNKAIETTSIFEKNRSTTFSPNCVAEYEDASLGQERCSLRKKEIDEQTIQTCSVGNHHRPFTSDTLTVKNQEGQQVLIDFPTTGQQVPRQENVARITNGWQRDPEYSDAHIARILMSMHKWDKWAPKS